MVCSICVRVISGRLMSVVGLFELIVLSRVMLSFLDFVLLVMLYGVFVCR